MTDRTPNTWKALRLAAGISQREAERRMGWQKTGYLSWIERGVVPSEEQERDMKALYASLLLDANIAEVAKPA